MSRVLALVALVLSLVVLTAWPWPIHDPTKALAVVGVALAASHLVP